MELGTELNLETLTERAGCGARMQAWAGQRSGLPAGRVQSVRIGTLLGALKLTAGPGSAAGGVYSFFPL